MNILIVSEKSGLAGSQYSISYLAKGLSKRGHQVYLACAPDTFLARLVKNSGVVHIPLTMKSRLDWLSMQHIAHVCRQYQIDIINAQSSRDRYNTILARWLYNLPVRLVHTRRQMAMSIGVFGQNWFYEKGTDRIVAVSQGVKKSLVKIGISPGHIEVIYNGTPAEKYASIDPATIAALKKKYEIQEHEIVIGSVSRLKEQHQILQALRHIRQKVKMIFAGIDPQPVYDSIIREFPVAHEVYFTGELSGEEVLHYYGLFTMHILASTIEGLSQSLLEAMALGVPVIATHMGGNPELIQDGENGLLFDNNDIDGLAHRIRQLIENPALRDNLATKAKKTALFDFSMENTVTRYEQFFERLLSNDGM